MHTPCVYDSFLRLPPPLARVCSILLSPQGVVGERERNPQQRLRCRGRCQQRADPQGRLGQLSHSRQYCTVLVSDTQQYSVQTRYLRNVLHSRPGCTTCGPLRRARCSLSDCCSALPRATRSPATEAAVPQCCVPCIYQDRTRSSLSGLVTGSRETPRRASRVRLHRRFSMLYLSLLPYA